MKRNLLLYLLFISNVIFAQNNLSVKFEMTYSNYDTDYLINEITILKDDQLFKKIKDPNEFVLNKSVPDGKYSFEYVNIFGERIKKEFSVPDNKNGINQSEVLLYVDKLQDSIPKDLFLQKIKNEEKIVIQFNFSSCYNGGKDSLIISKSKNNLYVLYKRKKRKLKPTELDFLLQYENELRHLKKTNFASTANGTNKMFYNSEELIYVEPSIYWGGYDLLKKRLKLE